MTARSASFRPVQVNRAFEDIAAQIRDELADGRLRAGDRLPPERELAERLHVSRNTLREALRSLEHAGLLDLKKGATGGAFIRQSNGDIVSSGLRDMYHLGAVTPRQVTDARIWIESMIVRAACARRTAADIAALDDNIAAVERALADKDFFARAKINLDFHRLLARSTQNPIMIVVMNAIADIMWEFIKAIGPRENLYVLPSRRRFMDYLVARDAEAAAAEMEQHLLRVNKHYLTLFDRKPRLKR